MSTSQELLRNASKPPEAREENGSDNLAQPQEETLLTPDLGPLTSRIVS